MPALSSDSALYSCLSKATVHSPKKDVEISPHCAKTLADTDTGCRLLGLVLLLTATIYLFPHRKFD